ncbi:hypothetical protein [Acidovorax radicis]|uniref:hypothetical protein n=1 Tax=Acidovorax radicis TaxID=758826 RepID=UPI001CF7F099|nr:hypothetical protein [Acidovorax radicis]UCU97275.1 hypothetical protein KI609_11640 [Acidovorax radicis]
MKSPLYLSLLLATALTLPVAALAASPAAQAHDHGHGAAATHDIELNAGKKWNIDAPLRQGMGAIHKAVRQTLPLAHAGKAQAADYDAFGAEISKQVAYIVENCKLEPKADAQLHTVIGEILQGVEAAQGQEGDTARAAGVVKVAQALNTYGSHFNHSGWKSIPLPLSH